jgi:hypothetical protein
MTGKRLQAKAYFCPLDAGQPIGGDNQESSVTRKINVARLKHAQEGLDQGLA